MLAEYQLMVSPILSYRVPKPRERSQKTATFFCRQGGHCGEVQLYFQIQQGALYFFKKKYLGNLPKSFAQSIIYLLFSLFRQKRIPRLIVFNRVGADLQMLKSGSNNIIL